MWIKVAGRLGEALGHAWIFPTRPTVGGRVHALCWG